MAFSLHVARLLAFSLLLLSVASCGTRTGKSTVSTTIGSRTVKATIDGGAWITTKDNAAIVSFGSHKIVIEDDRLLIDGEEQVQVSADAERVEIAIEDGRMTATVDGKQVLEKTLE